MIRFNYFSTNSNINKLVERSILPSPSKPKPSDRQTKQEKMKQNYPEGISYMDK